MSNTVQQLRIAEAANLLNVSTKTLRRWEAKGIIKSKRSPTGQRLYTLEQLEDIKNPKNKVKRVFNFKYLFLLLVLGVFGFVFKSLTSHSSQYTVDSTQSSSPSVLAATTTGISNGISEKYTFTVNVPSQFNDDVNVDGSVTADNLVYSVNGETGDVDVKLTAGTGISLDSTGLIVTNSGIVTLSAGDGITVSGNKITNSGILSLTAGSGISVSGSTITNTLDLKNSGWTDNGTSITLTTTTDTVTVDDLTAGDITASSLTTGGLSLNNNLTVASGYSLLPAVDLGSDIGAPGTRFNNLYVANINSNAGLSTAGQATFTYQPANETISQASVLINPTTATVSGQLLAFGIAGYQKALIDTEGDLILGYNSLTSAPLSDYPLNVYGHSGTRVSFTDTSGNGYFAGNVGVGTTAPGYKLEVAGSNVGFGNPVANNFNMYVNGGDTGAAILNLRADRGDNSADITIITQNDGGGLSINPTNGTVNGIYMTAAGNVGIGTTSPGYKLDVTGTANVSSNTTVGGTLGVTGIATLNSSLKFLESVGATYYTTIQAGNQSGNLTLTLPITSGTNGQFLSTNGSGTLAWASSSGSGDITTVGSMTSGDAFADSTADDDWLGLGASTGRIEFDDQTIDEVNILEANIGVGTTTPAAKLHVSGGNGGNASVIVDQTNTTGDILTASSSGNVRMTLGNTGTLSVNSRYTIGTPVISASTYETSTRYTNCDDVAYDAKVYAYQDTPAGRVYSSSYATTGQDIIYGWGGDCDNGSTTAPVVNWSAVAGATGYRVLVYIDLAAYNFNYYRDVTSNSFSFNPAVSAGSTVTPTILNNTSATFTDNVGIGTTQFGTNAVAVLSIASSTAPTTAITNGIQLYAVDVAGSHELKVMDEAANATTLSPHNFSLIDEGPSEEMAWSFYSERDGLAINADMTKALRLVESLSGEKLVYLKDLETGLEIENTISTESAVIKESVSTISTKLDEFIALVKSVFEGFKLKFVTKQSIQEELCIGTEENKTCLNKEQVDMVFGNLPSPTPTVLPTASPSAELLSPSPSTSPSATPSISPSPAPTP